MKLQAHVGDFAQGAVVEQRGTLRFGLHLENIIIIRAPLQIGLYIVGKLQWEAINEEKNIN